MLKWVIYLCFAISPLFAIKEEPSKETETKLKIKQPHWRLQVIESHPNKQPKKALYFEPLIGKNQDIPVKLLTLTESGLVESETDIIPLNEGLHNGYIEHGPSIAYNLSGTVESISFYDQGLLQDSIKTYYPNGVLHTFYAVKDGVLEGPFFKHHPDGEIAEKGSYIKGTLFGPYEIYNKYGKKIALYQYHEGLLEKEALEWFDDGVLKARFLYSKGLLNGDNSGIALTRYHPNGSVEEILNFQNGQPFGHHIRYYSDDKKEQYRIFYLNGVKHGVEKFLSVEGKVLSEGEYKNGTPFGRHIKKDISGTVIFSATFDETGKTVEPAKEFYANGCLKAEYFLQGNTLHGPYTEWHQNGNVAKRLKYKDGDLEGLSEEYYLEGTSEKLKVRTNFKDKKKQGLYEEWTITGVPKVSISYDKGIKQGTAITFHSNGKMATKANYVEGSYDGPYEAWDPFGTLILETAYIQGKEQGHRREWHSNGNLKYTAVLANGLNSGTEEEFHPNGQKSKSAFFNQGIPDREHCLWFEDGQLQEVHRYSKGLSIGECLVYHPPENGKCQVSRIINYSQGKLHGEQKSFYPDGKPQALMTYRDGLLFGKKILWDKEGRVLEEGNYNENGLQGSYYLKKPDGKEYIYHYNNNILEGPHQIYYPLNSDGRQVKAFDASYSNGLLDGEVAEYNEAGIKTKSTLYQNGLKSGLAKIYSDDGRLKIAAVFSADNQNEMAYEYYSNGNIKKQVLFIDDKKDGEEKLFFPNGEIASITHYKDGKFHGTASQWDENGTLIFEAEYKEGLKNGKFNKYDHDGKAILLQIYADDRLVEKIK